MDNIALQKRKKSQFSPHKVIIRHTTYKLLSAQKTTVVFSTAHRDFPPATVLPENAPAELLVPAPAPPALGLKGISFMRHLNCKIVLSQFLLNFS